MLRKQRNLLHGIKLLLADLHYYYYYYYYCYSSTLHKVTAPRDSCSTRSLISLFLSPFAKVGARCIDRRKAAS